VHARFAAASLLGSVTGWHLLTIVGVSCAFQSLFIHHGIAWLFDEGWPLYAAMQLHAGGVLYADVLFPFPPGHLLSAWIAYAIDPPGILLARMLYAAFTVALCAACYLLARRITTPTFALLAGLLLAVAAPRSHLSHLLFGYRYLLFSVLALLVFEGRLRAENSRQAGRGMLLAGVLAGIALFFRLTPAFAVSCGIGFAVLTASRDWRDWLRDWLLFAIGLALVGLPALAWFANTVGLEAVWREVVTRIVALQSAQSLPSPALSLLPDSSDRGDVYRWFVGLQYRVYIALYAVYALVLVALWSRALRHRRRFEHSLLLAIVIWGGLYLLRALGRSDDHHLMSALPPVCLLLGHGIGLLVQHGLDRARASGFVRSWVGVFVCVSVLSAWVYAMRVDFYLPDQNRGLIPLQSTGGQIAVTRPWVAKRIDAVVRTIVRSTRPDDIVLDMTGAPLLHLLTGRRGPGGIDVISPGIFLTRDEEEAFVARLQAAPPAVVLWPLKNFDRRADRSIERTAPELSKWVRESYREIKRIGDYRILQPR
jgi:4-amino-4-deoxy-L-arabinose transferase-like glycosyltransferase